MKNNRKKSVKVYLPGGAKEISELNDKQLKNVAHYNHLTDEEKKNVRNNLTKSGIMLSVAGGLSGSFMTKKPLRGAGIGAVTGAGIGALLGIRGHKLHKKQALAAEEEMKNREKDKQKVYSVTVTEDELKLFSEFLEQREFENNVSKEVRSQHPFNEEREKDASEFTSKVMQRFEEKSKAPDSKSSKREKIVTSPGSSKKISELTDEEKDSLLNSLSSNLEGNGESPKMIYNIKRFSRLSKLRDEIRSNNKLRDNFTGEDYKNHLDMRESSAKFARETVAALKDPNHEFTRSYEGQPKALKESIEFNKNLNRNETAAAKLLKEDPKKYFKKYTKHHNKQAIKNFISDSLGLGYKEEKW